MLVKAHSLETGNPLACLSERGLKKGIECLQNCCEAWRSKLQAKHLGMIPKHFKITPTNAPTTVLGSRNSKELPVSLPTNTSRFMVLFLYACFSFCYLDSLLPWLPSEGKVCLHCRRPTFNPWVGKIPWRRK